MKIDLNGKNVWQQACGDKKQNYSEVCIKWGVILNGPGSHGKWPECYPDITEERSAKKGTELRRFCELMKAGDIILLRLGTDTIIGVGEIIGDYFWSDNFGDIDGWDLEHARRVKWIWHDLGSPKIFSVYSLKFGDTTQTLTQVGEVWEWLNSLEVPEDIFNSPLPSLPLEWNFKTTIQEVSERLYHNGVSGNSINVLLREFDELVRICKWYGDSTSWPSERETVAYLVVPLLRALGWSPQKMAVEWNNIDLALFNTLPRKEDNLAVVVECKKITLTCLTAFDQAERYALQHPNCRRLIVTDGNRYGVYLKENDDFILKAYMNLQRLRSEYPVYNARGIQDALFMMTPEFSLV
ncbi:MAG TPA: hypothetical protein VGQ59_09900 [Cyclobacteriaceae bacterium]|nr:hypothetical protein [Cyclobacteriaceae bacterium]